MDQRILDIIQGIRLKHYSVFLDMTLKLSSFGEKLGSKSGILELMDDLGKAMAGRENIHRERPLGPFHQVRKENAQDNGRA